VHDAALKFLASEQNLNSMLEMEVYATSGGNDISFVTSQTPLHVVARLGLATICDLMLQWMVTASNNRYALIVNRL